MDSSKSRQRYEVFGVTREGAAIQNKGSFTSAPSESWMCAWGRGRRCAFVIRYFPSRKGWRVLDIRNIQEFTFGNGRRSGFKGMVRGARYWPTKDAAIMVAIQQLARHNCTQ